MNKEGRKKKTNARKIGRRAVKRGKAGSCKNRHKAGVLRDRTKAPRTLLVSDGWVWCPEFVVIKNV